MDDSRWPRCMTRSVRAGGGGGLLPVVFVFVFLVNSMLLSCLILIENQMLVLRLTRIFCFRLLGVGRLVGTRFVVCSLVCVRLCLCLCLVRALGR
ncbi:hypothetical protein BJX66DRAFT_294499 [Aspergillus keveii]|uniref:Uncharacterized protein n=1 Tax=Aspergillus keveii TaxID=714993 RepID=A0ABR4GIS1_9EURO